MAKKGRARRFREARELKQGFDDGLFKEGSRTLADAEESSSDEVETDEWDEVDDDEEDWDPDHRIKS